MPDRLELQLRSVEAWVDWPAPADDLADRVVARLEPRRQRVGSPAGRPWLAVAAAVLAVVVLSVAAVPGARHAVADWLGLAAVRITIGDGGGGDPPPRSLVLGDPVAVGSVGVEAGALGEADAAFRLGDATSLVWRLVGGGDVVLTTFPASSDGVVLHKVVDAAASVRRVDVDGAEGWWVDRSHVVRRGGETAGARAVLLWQRDGLVHRLESDLPLDDALRVARSVR